MQGKAFNKASLENSMSSEKLEKFLLHMKSGTEDKPLIVLKGHLLLEQAMYEYIAKRVKFPERILNKQINFAYLIYFASSLNDDMGIEWVWSALKIANSLRNQYSHSLEPTKADSLEKELVEYVQSNDGELIAEVDGSDINYNELSIAFLQVYDCLIHSSSNAESAKFKSKNGRSGIMKMLNLTCK